MPQIGVIDVLVRKDDRGKAAGRGRVPARRPRREVAPRGKARALGRRELRRRAARGRLGQVPAYAVQIWGGTRVLCDDCREYPSSRAAVPDPEPGATVSEVVAELLFESIEEVAAQRELCARDPERDFTRRRLVTLEMLLATLVTWGQQTLGDECRDVWGWTGAAPTPSAICQQWQKLSDLAMPALLRTFLRKFHVLAYLGRFRLLAADGTGIRVPDTGDERTRVRSNQSDAHHDELHPTCAYDVLRHTYEDAVFQGAKKSNEPAALCQLVDRIWAGVTREGVRLTNLWVADRNYCTFNVVCHMLESGSAFVIRAKDEWVRRFLGYDLVADDQGPTPLGGDAGKDEFDLTVTRYVTRSESASGRSRPRDGHLYRVVDSRQPFDALPPRSRGEYPLTLRIVRVRIEGPEDGDRDACGERWMNLVTNLPAGEFPPEVIEHTYRLRWSEETAYLHLKHVIGARVQHTHDYARLCQEVLGRLVLFDACSLGTSGVPIPEPGPVHERATDVKTAFKAMTRLLRGEDADVEEVASKSTHAVEEGRQNPRKKRLVRPTCFKYRC